MKVLLQDVIDAIDSTDDVNEFYYYIPEEKIILFHDGESMEGDLPEDLDGDLIALPSKYEINDYAIMEDFIEEVEDDKAREWLTNSIHGRGAFRMFRATCDRFGLTKEWYEYKEDAYEEIAINWCNEYGIEFDNRQIEYDKDNDEEILVPSKKESKVIIADINKNNFMNIFNMIMDKNVLIDKYNGITSSVDDDRARAELQEIFRMEFKDIFVASLNGKYLGYAIIIKKDNNALLHSLFVRKEERHKGIGTLLLKHAEEVAKENKLTLVTNVQPRNEIYQKFLASNNYTNVSYIQIKHK